MAEKTQFRRDLKRLQKMLDEIATLGNNPVRFKILKAKARKLVERIQRENPNVKSIPLQGEQDARRGPVSPAPESTPPKP